MLPTKRHALAAKSHSNLAIAAVRRRLESSRAAIGSFQSGAALGGVAALVIWAMVRSQSHQVPIFERD
jgi:hypothetical protein